MMFGLQQADLTALWITLQLATVSTLILLVVCTPLAWWLSLTRSRLKTLIEALVALPLVMPPTVLGFYLLISLGPYGPIGGALQALGGKPLAFSFAGLVVGSVLYSLPFVVQPLQNAFTGVGQRTLEAAATLRASPWDRFWSVAFPMARQGFVTATTLGFAHTVGEFGMVLMIGGNIPGRTQVLSIALYNHVETLEYGQAHVLAALMLVLSFVLLFGVYSFNGRFNRARP